MNKLERKRLVEKAWRRQLRYYYYSGVKYISKDGKIKTAKTWQELKDVWYIYKYTRSPYKDPYRKVDRKAKNKKFRQENNNIKSKLNGTKNPSWSIDTIGDMLL